MDELVRVQDEIRQGNFVSAETILDTILVRGHGSSQGLARDLLINIVESDHILLLSN